MEKIKPYKNLECALQSLDNGGRFFNFQTKAEDGIITQSELGKVGGVFIESQQLILFLEMSLLELDQSDKDAIILKLDSGLQKKYLKYKPQSVLPSEAGLKGIISSNAIITGTPKLIDSKTSFNGFIMFPMVSGNVTSYMMIPLIDEYEVYELGDGEASETFLIAHQKGYEKLPSKKMTVGGVLKELNETEEEDGAKVKFLEALYLYEH